MYREFDLANDRRLLRQRKVDPVHYKPGFVNYNTALMSSVFISYVDALDVADTRQMTVG